MTLIASLSAACTDSPPGQPPASVGVTQDRAVTPAILDIPLVDERGQITSLGAFRGKVLVVADFLTSCQEECPITTGAFLQMRADVAHAGVGARVVFAEISVDPERDTPARLAAYAKLTGIDLHLLTGTPANLAALWHYFGIYYQKVPEADPPGIDWETGKPYTYDIDHSDGFFIIDATGHERFLTAGMADLHGRLPSSLAKLLDDDGRHDLAHPSGGSWTVTQGLVALSWVVGKTIPPAAG
jgi:protein SCO1